MEGIEIKYVKSIFVIYICFLYNFVLFKYFGSTKEIYQRIQVNKGLRARGNLNLNFHPFESISLVIENLRDGNIEREALYFLANIIVFIPLGFLLPSMLKKNPFYKTIAYSLIFILSIEIIQFFSLLGTADVDDVIVNLCGCAIGHLIYKVAKPIINRFNGKVRFLS